MNDRIQLRQSWVKGVWKVYCPVCDKNGKPYRYLERGGHNEAIQRVYDHIQIVHTPKISWWKKFWRKKHD